MPRGTRYDALEARVEKRKRQSPGDNGAGLCFPWTPFPLDSFPLQGEVNLLVLKTRVNRETKATQDGLETLVLEESHNTHTHHFLPGTHLQILLPVYEKVHWLWVMGDAVPPALAVAKNTLGADKAPDSQDLRWGVCVGV